MGGETSVRPQCSAVAATSLGRSSVDPVAAGSWCVKARHALRRIKSLLAANRRREALLCRASLTTGQRRHHQAEGLRTSECLGFPTFRHFLEGHTWTWQELKGERLHFELVGGTGPNAGWVSLKVKAHPLAVTPRPIAQSRLVVRNCSWVGSRLASSSSKGRHQTRTKIEAGLESRRGFGSGLPWWLNPSRVKGTILFLSIPWKALPLPCRISQRSLTARHGRDTSSTCDA